MNKRKGFTLIELMVVVVIIGILANVAIPNYIQLRKRAEAIRIISDFLIIREAALEYRWKTNEWPRDYYPGQLPPELKEYLPEGFTFNLKPRFNALYDWENWVRRDGRPKHEKTGILIGFSVTTKDMSIVNAIFAVYRGNFKWSLNNNYTFVIVPIGEDY